MTVPFTATLKEMAALTAGCPCAPSILGVRDGLKVIRVEAQLVAAEMIDLKPIGNRAMGEFVRNSVNVLTASTAA